MSNLAKLDFVALDITGKNHLQWVLDAEIHLAANGLGETIKEKNTTTDQEKAKAMIFSDPLTLSMNLKERYDHLKTVILPKVRYDWIHFRLQDFKSICDYNSVMYGITLQLTLWGEKISDSDISRGRNHGYRGRRGNNFGNYRGGRCGQFKRSYSHQKLEQNNGPRDKDKMNADNFCNICGCKGHWSRTCRTLKIEANFTAENDKVETNFANGKDNYRVFLDVSDFFSGPDGRIDHLIGD
ncbi:hypothetical protein RND81_05G221700 [Saponaria officinalis]|uniref:CCHC-type domain-containing protein n=1 Tax=Saponaria officinalis TaxID=3572 RepID=A0AAW1L322_SAPOF